MPGTSPSTLGQAFRTSIPDEGFPITQDLFNILRGHTGLSLTLTTTPKLVLTSDYLTAQWDATVVAAALAKVYIPPTLAFRPSKASATINIPFPRFRVHLRARMAGASDTPRITLTAQARAADGAIKATFTPKSNEKSGETDTGVVLTDGTCAALTNATNPAVRTWDFFEVYGTGPVYLAPGDYIDLKFVPAAHGTDAIEVHGATVSMHVNPNYTTESQRS